MAIPTRIIKRRIKSIRSTRKIMKAMELVAASKMRRAVQQTLASRPYAGRIREMTDEVRKRIDPLRHALLVGSGMKHPDKPLRVLLLVAASDRGLCGGFNNQLIKKAIEFMRVREKDDLFVATIGRRAESVARRSRRTLEASFESISNAPAFERVKPMAAYALQGFLRREFDRVFVAFTDFRSALSQVPNVEQLLPIVPEEELSGGGWQTAEYEQRGGEAFKEEAVIFEPGADDVLNALLPRLVETRLYQSLLESAASEHSARMLAMRSAGDAAGDMLEDLTLTLNQARQSSITREISEISAGKAAIE